MGVTRVHGLYGVEAGSELLGGITQQDVQTGTEVAGEPTSGSVEARFQSVVSQKPTASFTTLAIKTAIDTIALQGADIASLTGGLKLYVQKHKTGGTRDGGATHRKYAIAQGLVLPRTLSVTHQENASIAYGVAVTHDGSGNPPIVVTDNVSLPSGLTDAERFALGPVTIGGVTIPQVRSVELDFGIQEQTEATDSDIFDTFVSIRTIQPVLVIRGIDLEWLKESGGIPFSGKAGTHSDTSVYLRKRASGGTFVADATAQHIKFTAFGLAVIETPMDVSGANELAEATLRMQLIHDGTNQPLLVNTAIAIN